MKIRYSLFLSIAMILTLFVNQSASFAGMASRGFVLKGKTRYFGSRHLPITQPPPVQATATVNVRDFGATGNGVTDDTQAIRNAIAAAKASGQGVLFPAGTYLHTQAIIANSVSL